MQDLSERYHVARETIRQALDVLRGEKLVAAQSTRGIFVLREAAEQQSSEYEAVTKRLDEVIAEMGALRERLAEVEERVLPGESSSLPGPQQQLLVGIKREVQDLARLLARMRRGLETAGIALADTDQRDTQAM